MLKSDETKFAIIKDKIVLVVHCDSHYAFPWENKRVVQIL